MRILTVSNRLPITISKKDGNFKAIETQEGLASGLNDFLKSKSGVYTDYLWFGGSDRELPVDSEELDKFLRKHRIVPVEVAQEIKEFSQYFCDRTIWPLFHYFPSRTSYDSRHWANYILMNEAFCNSIQRNLRPDDMLWILDYHLMLLPKMVKKIAPKIPIGFFLKIPFPAFEVFRQLPSAWSTEILEGILSSNLIGFQTDGYAQSFNRCVGRMFSLEQKNNKFRTSNHTVQIGTFPAGINFKKFHDSVFDTNVAAEIETIQRRTGKCKIILSVDRLDYSKGILNRLSAYEKLLGWNKLWHGKVTLILVVAPSQAKDEHYQSMKKKIDETVGRINGKFGTFDWNPIVYQYQFLSFKKLAALYNCSDVLLVIPLREGMNLIAKEYVAARKSKTGVLVLSEMAGASKELGEAILVNPNDIDAIVNSIQRALILPFDEQANRMERMQNYIKTNDVFHWADSFLDALISSVSSQQTETVKSQFNLEKSEIVKKYKKAKRRLLLLDYDGTLVPFAIQPEEAVPSQRVKTILRLLSHHQGTKVVLISGRPRNFLDEWFSECAVNIIAEHGVWSKENGNSWQLLGQFDSDWKSEVIPILNRYKENLPGSIIEEKEYSVVFHYRACDLELLSVDLPKIKETLAQIIDSSKLEMIEGHMILEIRPVGADKGKAVLHFLNQERWSFILAVGDDRTDEDIFRCLPEQSISVKVGLGFTEAKFSIETYEHVLDLLEHLASSQRNV